MASDSENGPVDGRSTSRSVAEALEVVKKLTSDGRLDDVDATALQDLRRAIGDESPANIVQGVIGNRWKISPEGWKTILRTGIVMVLPMLWREWQELTPEASEAVLAKLSNYWSVLLTGMGSVAGFEAWRKDR